ncbi:MULTISPECIES: DUF4294 domain-containing protein [unclassified Lentimicrobium]|uniref:DUF4294 domain-containing protein n=1 Tax=unclassified Lentimicrobium TaxID=2677434 RepID=UPI001551F2D6|nr:MULTISPECIES: DUF4294 domain-containing protein [unclassified Lentimicrobium]NPD44708.1 DUF4294 domain-containing protein [Lentimicrobium sp. S6]NPD83436.1 DUF4294 domain-containing protein [Lentimicrobium sp. L6]
MIRAIIIIVLSIGYSHLFSQTNGVIPAYIENGDTIYVEFLNEVEVKAPLVFDSKRNAKRYSRVVRYVKKVYPYAKVAGIKMREYEAILEKTDKKRDRKKIMRRAEQELKEEFENELKQLTYMQGEILLKLIDRETNTSGYELVKDMRGGFKATFYQSSARLFGFNLKDRYDPEGRDKELEYIVQLIEQGKL